MGRTGEPDKAVEFIPVLSFVHELNAARAVREEGELTVGEAVRCVTTEEDEEAIVIAVKLVKVQHLRGVGRVIGTTHPAGNEGGLPPDGVHINSDGAVDDVVTRGGMNPAPFPWIHGRESGRGVRVALREEEGHVALEVDTDGEGDEFAVKGQTENMAGASRGCRGRQSVGVRVEELVPMSVASRVGHIGGCLKER